MPSKSDRRLYQLSELPDMLQLSPEQIRLLINTDQLHAIRIAGEVRFDSCEIDALIGTYAQIARRKKEHAN